MTSDYNYTRKNSRIKTRRLFRQTRKTSTPLLGTLEIRCDRFSSPLQLTPITLTPEQLKMYTDTYGPFKTAEQKMQEYIIETGKCL